MIPAYRYAIEERAVEDFVKLPDDEQDLLLAFFRWLAAHPDTQGDGWHKDASERINYASLCGPFIVVHWCDHAVCEVRIVEFIRG